MPKPEQKGTISMQNFYGKPIKIAQTNEIDTTTGIDLAQNESYRGSLQQILADNIGDYVVVEFLIGSQNMVTRQGILYSVGVSYIILYDEQNGLYTVCDLYSIKFVTFYPEGTKPPRNNNTSPMTMRR